MNQGNVVELRGTPAWTWRSAGLGAALWIATALPAHAAPGGTLDTGFGAGGVAPLGSDSDGNPAIAQAIAFQSGGRIVTVGAAAPTPSKWVVRRYLANGDRDVSFGTAGRTVLFGAVSSDVAWDVVVGPDDRIYVGGIVSRNVGTAKKPVFEWNYGIACLLENGTLDASWGTGGTRVVLLNAGAAQDQKVRIVRQPDGKILVVGRSGPNLGVVRLTATGALDTAFAGGAGMTTLTLAGGAGIVMGAALDLSDRLLILTQRGSYAAAYLLRLTPSGTLDPTFPVRDVYADFPVGLAAARRAQGLAVQANGYPVVSYSVNVTGLSDVALVRYSDAGSPDSGFGSGGFTRTGLTQGLTARGLTIESDGSLLVASHVTVTTAPAWSATVFRFFAGGALDTSYGTGGMASPIGSASPGTGPTINDLELAPNGRAFLVCTGVPDVRILVAYLGN